MLALEQLLDCLQPSKIALPKIQIWTPPFSLMPFFSKSVNRNKILFLLQNTYNFFSFAFLIYFKNWSFDLFALSTSRFPSLVCQGLRKGGLERNCHSLTATAKILEIAIELGTLCAIVLLSSAGVLHDGGLDGNIFGQVLGKTMGKKPF